MVTRRERAFGGAVAVFLVCAAAPRASADPGAGDGAGVADAGARTAAASPGVPGDEPQTSALTRARERFRSGVEAARLGRFDAAHDAFLESLRERPHAATYYNLALSELELGLRRDALLHLSQALEGGGAAGELAPDTAELARARYHALSLELSRVFVELGSPDAELEVGGETLRAIRGEAGEAWFTPQGGPVTGPRARGRFVVLLEAGSHRLELWRGERSSTVELDLPAGSTRRLHEADFERRDHSPRVRVAPPPAVTATKVPAPPRDTVIESSSGKASARDTVMWTSFGVAAASLASFAILGTYALSEDHALEARCPERERCPRGTLARAEKVERLALAADLSLLLGLAAGGLGAWLALAPAPQGGGGASRPSIGMRGRF